MPKVMCACGKLFEYVIYQTMAGDWQIDGKCAAPGRVNCKLTVGPMSDEKCKAATETECVGNLRQIMSEVREERRK